MKRPLDVVIFRGVVGGLLAGVVVAAWFFLVDAIRGQPFHTPAVLASAFFARDSLQITFSLVGFYTILHFGVFSCLGAITALALEALDTPPSLRGGAVFGVVVLDLVFYGALLATGREIFLVLPWAHVLLSNMTGGMVMMTYLHRSSREERAFGPAVIAENPLLRQGLFTGLIGAAAVALWFLILDMISGQPLRTPAALASVLFLGAKGPGDVHISLGVVAGYTVLHVAVFAAIGTALTLIAREVERAPQLLLMVVLSAIVLEAVAGPAMALTAAWGLGAVGWWSVGMGNLLAVAAMGWWIWRTHPDLRRTLRQPVKVLP
jgi:hypothetical protein